MTERQSATKRGYGGAWAAAAAAFKATHPYCLGCAAVGQREATAVVDHVEPHKGDKAKFWNRAMWQPCCRWHHDAIKSVLERRFAAGEVDAAELWLNSATAIKLTRSRNRAPIGADGWLT